MNWHRRVWESICDKSPFVLRSTMDRAIRKAEDDKDRVIDVISSLEFKARQAREEEKNRHRSTVRELNSRHDAELTEVKSAIDSVIDKASCIKWSTLQESPSYMLQMELDAQLFGMMSSDNRELGIAADRIAHQVRKQIATSKFVKMAERNW